MVFYNRSVGRKISSAAMAATAADSLSDCLATSAVLLGTLAGRFLPSFTTGSIWMVARQPSFSLSCFSRASTTSSVQALDEAWSAVVEVEKSYV